MALLLKSKDSVILVRLISRSFSIECRHRSWHFINPNPYLSEGSMGVFRDVDSSGKQQLSLQRLSYVYVLVSPSCVSDSL